MNTLLVSDFNLGNLAGYLRNSFAPGELEVVLAPLGQVAQTLGSPAGGAGGDSASRFVFVWTQPEAVLPSFGALLRGEPVGAAALDADVDEFARQVLHAAEGAAVVLVATWALPLFRAGSGADSWRDASGARRLLARANLRLAEAVGSSGRVLLLPAEAWVQSGGTGAYSARLWYGGKIPWSNEVFKAAAAAVAATLRGLRGGSRKLIVLDLDDTLWGGIVGDAGWEGLVLGGHDPEGEALVDFQRALKALSRRGVALAVLSKNTEETALEAIRRHPEMVLREDDFAGWRINWSDKAQNLAELARELNLGLGSVVFIDDNPAERARVREAFPEVLVPEWPADKRLYPEALLGLDCFSGMGATDEDRKRAQMYTEQRRRSEERDAGGSLEGWLGRLEQVVTAGPLDRGNLPRVVQLLNKTNQMNLSTRRMAEAEFSAWAEHPSRRAWAFRVSDRFGDSGLTGILSVELRGNICRIVDFVLSCRVMGRKVEETMLHIACEWARRAGAEKVVAVHEPTAKNQPCLELFKRSGFVEEPGGRFTWEAVSPYPACEAVKLVESGMESEVAA